MSKPFDDTDTSPAAFGERMRRERELRGISLDEISATTKIGTRLLRALEDEQFDLLPGGIFNKGYVRAYARHLGIDEEQAVADYLKAVHETPPDVRLIAHQNASTHADHISSTVFSRGGFPLTSILILFVVIVGAAGGWRLYQQRQRDRRQPTSTSDMTAAPSSSTSQATSSSSSSNSPQAQASRADQASIPSAPPSAKGSSEAPVRTAQAAQSPPHPSSSGAASAAALSAGSEANAPFEVTVRAKDRAWVSIKSDGKVLVRGVIKPPEVKTVHATNEVVFWTGNAGEVELSFNGKSIPLKSGENDEQMLVFNSHGLLPQPATQ